MRQNVSLKGYSFVMESGGVSGQFKACREEVSLNGGLWKSGTYKSIGQANNPLITIITVVFNGERLLEKTILSVLHQGYSQVEFIIIDGGSTDGTVDLLRKYNDHIDYWVSESDSGIYEAMNKALKISRGDYVWFINSGDEVGGNDVLEKIMLHGASHDYFYGNTRLVREDGSDGKLVVAPKLLDARKMYRGMYVSHQSIIVRRSIASLYDLSIKLTADQKWIIDVLKKAKSGVYVNKVFSRYLLGGMSDIRAMECVLEKYALAKRELAYADFLGVALICCIQILKLNVRNMFRVFK